MEPERKKPGGCPPKTEQKPYFVHTAALTGIAVFRIIELEVIQVIILVFYFI